jgi:pSer/pThr/pTyr-binding forkhead associated (FHA) protein
MPADASAETAAGGSAQTTAAGLDPTAAPSGTGAASATSADLGDPNATAVKPVVPGPRAAAGSWRMVVTADAAYHARMQAQADPDAEPIALPAFIPERRFLLDRPQILIGRRSRSRGIEPEVDLSGPPGDPAVSHAHALLVQQPDGTWSVVDLDSSNGTYLNDSADGLPANVPTALADGDVLHVGAWTALTIRST